MKIIVAVLMAASLMACGGKAKKSATPDNQTGTTETTTPDGTGATTPDGTGGTTYGGANAPAPQPAAGTEPAPGM